MAFVYVIWMLFSRSICRFWF